MSRPGDRLVVHGAVVAFGGRGVLILGPSGSGKSGLALRLIAGGARLVADDRVELVRAGEALVARAPAPISGLIEARGLGILRIPALERAEIAFAVDLGRAAAARMPQPETITYLDIKIDLHSGRELPNIDAVVTILLKNGRVVPS